MKDRLQNKGVVLALATLCCLLWGSAYPAVKIGYELFGITTTGAQVLFAGYRFTLAGILTWIITSLYVKKIALPQREEWGRMISLGLVQTTLQYIFFYIGLANTTGVKASIINATSTFFAILFAHLILKNEKMTRAKIIGCILGMVGVIIIQLKGGRIDSSFSLLGDGFLFLVCIASALGAVMTRIYTQKSDSMILTAYQLMIGGVVLVMIGLLMGGSITQVTVPGLLLLGYLAALSAAAFSIWTILLKHNPVGVVAIYGFMIPVFGVILSGLFLGEAFLSLRILVSLACVSVGIWLVNREAGRI
ncbi:MULTISPECIES: DMT family transporter [Acetobacterium]|uniref:DMT family transporter n=1 Tax=Acetobacterium TaxID=33951 RepID=UPI000B9CD474|nr:MULTISPECIES: DMT family transporter [Acetobacterium]MEA4805795.1 DMT family transporter [Acetobacterium wieringae]OXS27374.1 MAG: multidrug DMT transporter [Acetobacterium sp. MES1]HAZ06390.1 EamA family transporter [Acetobacterium sp.]